jgi:2-hydroxychromene-2-carboxylate isomerase
MSFVVDYFFSIGSPWTYLGQDHLRRLDEKYGLIVRPQPVTILPENGAIPLRDRPAARSKYYFTDLKRWADHLGKPVVLENRPTGDWLPASFMVVAAVLDGLDWWTLSGALQRAWWAEARDMSDRSVRAQIAEEAGFDGAVLLAREDDPDVRATWAANISHATTLGVFGSPTYVFRNELYWGQDSLPFLDRALAAAAQAAS